MSRFALAIPLLFAASAAASAAPRVSPSYAFGRTGGNIEPFTISIAADGVVAVNGPVRALVHQVSPAAMARLAVVFRTERFSKLPPATRCAGELPDIAAQFVTVRGATTRTVLVHGDCSPRFTKVYDALAQAAGLRYGTG
jgi:hypothetical protein